LFCTFKKNIKIRDIKEKIKVKKLGKIIINEFKKRENAIKKGKLSDLKP